MGDLKSLMCGRGGQIGKVGSQSVSIAYARKLSIFTIACVCGVYEGLVRDRGLCDGMVGAQSVSSACPACLSFRSHACVCRDQEARLLRERDELQDQVEEQCARLAEAQAVVERLKVRASFFPSLSPSLPTSVHPPSPSVCPWK